MEEIKMNVSSEAVDQAASSDEEKLDFTLELYDPFMFDGVSIEKIDLSGLLDLKASDMCEIDRQMMIKGYNSTSLEITRQYAMFVAAKVNKKPMEFCNGMKARDCIRLRQMVTTFFYVRG